LPTWRPAVGRCLVDAGRSQELAAGDVDGFHADEEGTVA
jgi:hypothetical protein